ncbi:MAG: antibiotic biosynthesis monooxygenase family protein [Gemmatimonadales bacterium]
MFHILWQFETTDVQLPEFAAAYGPTGPWAEFFRGAAGYLGTELFERSVEPPRFLTVDHWTSRDAYEAFRRARATEYATLDAACEGLTTAERFLTAWED